MIGRGLMGCQGQCRLRTQKGRFAGAAGDTDLKQLAARRAVCYVVVCSLQRFRKFLRDRQKAVWITTAAEDFF